MLDEKSNNRNSLCFLFHVQAFTYGAAFICCILSGLCTNTQASISRPLCVLAVSRPLTKSCWRLVHVEVAGWVLTCLLSLNSVL